METQHVLLFQASMNLGVIARRKTDDGTQTTTDHLCNQFRICTSKTEILHSKSLKEKIAFALIV